MEFLCHINEYFKVLFQLILLVAQYKYDRHFMSHLVIKSKVHYAGLCRKQKNEKNDLYLDYHKGLIKQIGPYEFYTIFRVTYFNHMTMIQVTKNSKNSL